MNTKNLIGQKINDILVRSKWETGGLDEAEVFIQLENGKIVGIPYSFSDENIEKEIDKKANSLFTDLSDFPVFYVNPERKSIEQVLEAKRKRASTVMGRLKSILGLGERIPKEYKTYKTEYRENKIKYLKDQLIIDFLMFEDSTDKGFLELENGYIITEVTMAPHGTGLAGLNYYASVKELESRHGTDYKRITSNLS